MSARCVITGDVILRRYRRAETAEIVKPPKNRLPVPASQTPTGLVEVPGFGLVLKMGRVQDIGVEFPIVGRHLETHGPGQARHGTRAGKEVQKNFTSLRRVDQPPEVVQEKGLQGPLVADVGDELSLEIGLIQVHLNEATGHWPETQWGAPAPGGPSGGDPLLIVLMRSDRQKHKYLMLWINYGQEEKLVR